MSSTIEKRDALKISPLLGIPLVQPDDDLPQLIINSLRKNRIILQKNDIIVIAQKIISKAEKRIVNLETVIPSRAAVELSARVEKDPRFVELVIQESNEVLRAEKNLLIVQHRLGFVCANAGIDQSNVTSPNGEKGEWVLLLPKDPDKSAEEIRSKIELLSGVKPLGVMIIDSHGRAWRMGIIGTAIGISGVPGIVDMRGKPDLFGYNLRITLIAAADELAAAASLMMGQAAESIPAVHVRGFPYEIRTSTIQELIRPKHQDLFR